MGSTAVPRQAVVHTEKMDFLIYRRSCFRRSSPTWSAKFTTMKVPGPRPVLGRIRLEVRGVQDGEVRRHSRQLLLRGAEEHVVGEEACAHARGCSPARTLMPYWGSSPAPGIPDEELLGIQGSW